jgi:hypothetical protein
MDLPIGVDIFIWPLIVVTREITFVIVIIHCLFNFFDKTGGRSVEWN